MTYAEFTENAEEGTARLHVHGHSGYAERGKDIVCAGVSVLVQTLALYLAEKGFDPEIVRGDGEMCVKAPYTGAAITAFEFCLTGLYALSDAFPDNIKILFQKS